MNNGCICCTVRGDLIRILGNLMKRRNQFEPFARFDWDGASLIVTWSPDGRWVATSDLTASVHLYDFTRAYPLHIHGYGTKVKAMDFSPDGYGWEPAAGTTITL